MKIGLIGAGAIARFLLEKINLINMKVYKLQVFLYGTGKNIGCWNRSLV